MNHELLMFCHSLFTGILLLVIYDVLRILRKVFPHRSCFVSAEDLIYWMGSGILIFMEMYRQNQGIVRTYIFAGTLVGMVVYHFTVSSLFVRFTAKILEIPVKYLFFLTKRLIFSYRRCRISVYSHSRQVVAKIRKNQKRSEDFNEVKEAESNSEEKPNGHG